MSDNKYTNEFFEEYEKKYTAEQKTDGEKTHTSHAKRNTLKKTRAVLLCVVAIVLVAVLAAVLIFKPPVKTNGQDANISVPSVPSEPVPEPEPPFATFATENTAAFAYAIKSEYGVLIDADTGEIIYQKNADAKIYPASLTKILTLLVAVENITDFNDTFQMTSEIIDPHYRADASMAGFAPEEIIPIRDLLYGAVLPSGADATTALGIYVAGTEQEFAALMNKKIEQLGITTAHFCNTSGLHDNNHYCTVKDMAVILKAAMDNETCREILSTYQYTTTATPQNPEGLPLVSTMFSRMTGEEPEGATILGGKTGFTNEAGNCLATFGKNDAGRNFIMVTVKADYKWKSIFDHIHTYSTLAPETTSENTESN